MSHWWTEPQRSSYKSPLEVVTLSELKAILTAAPPVRDITKVIDHHTWLPSVSQYGEHSWRGVQLFHRIEREWSDIGYHIGISPDGTICLLRPVSRSGGHTLGHNSNSIGLCMLGNYDKGHDDPTEIMALGAEVTALLCKRYKLTAPDVWFHRDFANKSCPGSAMSRTHVRSLVNAAMQDGGEVPEEPEIETETIKIIAYGSTHVLASYEMVPNGNHLDDQGKVYVKR